MSSTKWQLARIVFMGLTLSACQTTGSSTETAANLVSDPAHTTAAADADAKASSQLASVYVPQAYTFIGQPTTMLTQYFGEPTLIRREGDAEVRQFLTQTRQGPCVLLAFVYEDRGQEAPGIRHMVVREGTETASDPDRCLRELAYAHKWARSG